MDQKLLYTAPEVEPLVIRFEGIVCTSPFGGANQAGQGLGEDDDYTYGY